MLLAAKVPGSYDATGVNLSALSLWLQADEGKLTNLKNMSESKAARVDSQKARLQELAGESQQRIEQGYA